MHFEESRIVCVSFVDDIQIRHNKYIMFLLININISIFNINIKMETIGKEPLQ